MPKKADTQAKKNTTQKIPNIVSFDQFLKLRGEQKEPLTIYFDEQQWKTLTKGLRPVDGKLPKKGIRLALFTSPSMPGGFGTLSSARNSGLMLVGKGVVSPMYPIPDAGNPGGIPNREGPGDIPDPKDWIFEGKLVHCSMRFSQQVRCEGICSSGNCRLVVYREATGSRWQGITISCECRP
jgi:hypothetical protein